MTATTMTTTKTVQDLTKSMYELYNSLNEWGQETFGDNWTPEEFAQLFEKNAPNAAFKKQAAPKDPNAPKKARNGYILFCQEMRQWVKTKDLEDAVFRDDDDIETMDMIGNDHELAEFSGKDLTKKLGEAWKAIKGTALSARWNRKVEEDKERYEKEMEEYTPPTEEELAEILAKKGVKKARKAGPKKVKQPKRPRSAYQFFCDKHRANVKEQISEDHPDLKGRELNSEVIKALGEMWSDMKNYHDEGENRDKNGKFDYEEEAQEFLDLAAQAKENFVPPPVEVAPEVSDNSSDSGDDVSQAEVESGDDASQAEVESDNESVAQLAQLAQEDDLDDDLEEEDDDEEEEATCTFVLTRANKKKGKKKGDLCGGIIFEGCLCKKHHKRVAKDDEQE